MTTTAPTPDEQVTYNRYEPHRAGLPNMRVYLRDLWNRREFAIENSRAGMRAANTMTFFGQAWLVINPLLLAFVYYMIVSVLSGKGGFDAERLAHITGGIFLFYFFQGAVLSGAASVTGAGKMVVNTAFPRLLLPIGAVRTALYRFFPTIPVYFIFHFIAGNPFNFVTVLVTPIFLMLLAVFALGLSAFFSAAQVYFRDTSSFLPYIMRIWLYVSPVLLTMQQINSHGAMRMLAPFNPLYSIIGGYQTALQYGQVPHWHLWVLAFAWTLVALVFGCFYFLTRERDFAVRL